MTRLFLSHDRLKIAASLGAPLSASPAYSAGDALGGLWTFAGALAACSAGVIENIEIVDTLKQKQPLDIFFFDSNPTTTTVTDNAAVTLNAADQPRVLGAVSILAANYFDFSNVSVASITTPLPFTLSNVPSTGVAPNRNLYAIALTRGTPTYASGALLPYITIRRD